jgi:hypothetical protein
MADYSKRKIQDIRRGDMVQGYDNVTKTLRPTRVYSLTAKTSHAVLQFNGLVKCTPEHRILSEKDGEMVFVRADDLRAGNFIIDEMGTKTEILTIERLEGDFNVYDLDEDKPRTYFANGFVVEDSTPTGHGDSPTHTDTPHTDHVHADTTHLDTAHNDTTHLDTAHADIAHSDTVHADTVHADTPHDDTTHGDIVHGDTTHGDTAHGDTSPHTDSNASLVLGYDS